MERNTVYFKDSSNMNEIEDNSIALVITSPPYWNVKDYSLDGYQREKKSEKMKRQIGDIESFNDYILAMLAVWKECERVLRPNGKIAINTPLMPIIKKNLSTHYSRDIVDINASIESSIIKNTGLFLYDVWIWNRTNPTKKLMFGSYPYPPNFYAQNTIEFITVFVKDGQPPIVSDERKERSKLSEQEWVDFTKQVWDIPVPNKNDVAYGIHPAIMPEEIVRRLIRMFSFEKDIVLDPFLGSGTTAKVSIELKRDWIGYEINEKFKEIIFAKVGQKRLF